MEYNLAILPDRVKAAVIDSIIIILMMYGATEILALFSDVPSNVRMIIFVLIFFLYDRLLIAVFGSKIGY